jgi:transcription initiation factor TFIIH subunit 1
MSSAAAQYKKKNGTLSVSADGKTVSWEGEGPGLAIAIADIGSRWAASYTKE